MNVPPIFDSLDFVGLIIGELVLTLKSILNGESPSQLTLFFNIGEGKFFFISTQAFSTTRLFN